jgi:hypothetical protein
LKRTEPHRNGRHANTAADTPARHAARAPARVGLDLTLAGCADPRAARASPPCRELPGRDNRAPGPTRGEPPCSSARPAIAPHTPPSILHCDRLRLINLSHEQADIFKVNAFRKLRKDLIAHAPRPWPGWYVPYLARACAPCVRHPSRELRATGRRAVERAGPAGMRQCSWQPSALALTS